MRGRNGLSPCRDGKRNGCSGKTSRTARRSTLSAAPEFEPDRTPEITPRKDAYTPHELDVIRNGVQNGESAVMIAWRLNRGVYGVRDRIRMMRRRGEI